MNSYKLHFKMLSFSLGNPGLISHQQLLITTVVIQRSTGLFRYF